MEVWTIEDMNNGRCDLEDLGNPKRELEPEVLPAIDIGAKSLRERLRDDALQAYAELGGVEYLKKKPDLLDKILVKQAMPETTVTVQGLIAPDQWIVELSARRLAYRKSLDVAQDITEKGLPAPSPSGETEQ